MEQRQSAKSKTALTPQKEKVKEKVKMKWSEKFDLNVKTPKTPNRSSEKPKLVKSEISTPEKITLLDDL